MQISYQDMFSHMHPNFFQQERISSLTKAYEEMVLPLADFRVDAVTIPVQETSHFGEYHGSREALLAAVAQVDESWVPLYKPDSRVYCGWDGDQIASFCLIENMGTYQPEGAAEALRIAGPGCVGTVPAFRRRGIGLRMVQLATDILRSEGYDISYIHYTGVAPWYARLGYRTVLTWTGSGFLSEGEQA